MTDPLLVLHNHNHWSTRKLLEACRGLSREQFHAPHPIGHGSLHANLTHIVGAMRRWCDRVAGGHVRASIEKGVEAKDRSPERLIELLDEASAGLAQVTATIRARPGGLESTVDFVFEEPAGTRKIVLPASVALVHVYTHGQHHRAQCLNMLRRLGITTDSGDFDAVEWWNVEGKASTGRTGGTR